MTGRVLFSVPEEEYSRRPRKETPVGRWVITFWSLTFSPPSFLREQMVGPVSLSSPRSPGPPILLWTTATGLDRDTSAGRSRLSCPVDDHQAGPVGGRVEGGTSVPVPSLSLLPDPVPSLHHTLPPPSLHSLQSLSRLPLLLSLLSSSSSSPTVLLVGRRLSSRRDGKVTVDPLDSVGRDSVWTGDTRVRVPVSTVP